MENITSGSDGRLDIAKGILVNLKTLLDKPPKSTKIKEKRLNKQENIEY